MKRATILSIVAVFVTLASPAASATIIFDLTGQCQLSCDRFGLADFDFFDETAVLGLADGTDTSQGALLNIDDIEFFTLFGIDFLTGNVVAANDGFAADGVLGGFSLVNGANAFCYHVARLTCGALGFDTIVGAGDIAAGGDGHGPAQFTRGDDTVNVPEPGTLGLLGIGLFAMGLSRRRKTI